MKDFLHHKSLRCHYYLPTKIIILLIIFVTLGKFDLTMIKSIFNFTRNRTLTTCMAVLTTISIWGAPITPQDASAEASAFLNSNPKGLRAPASQGVALKLAYTCKGSEQALFYIFNNSDGFVIVSADDRFPAILGYSESGRFDESKIPVNMKTWLDGYAAEMTHYMAKLPDGIGREGAPLKASRQPIEPLITTKWDQDSPYNLLCPTDTYGRAVTGCVATAYAQIMKYHQWPLKPQGSNAGVNFDGTTFNWRQMIDEYTDGNYTATQATAVATLMRQCGAAVDMQYSSWSSGAYSFDVQPALTRYFLYDPSLKMLWKDYTPQSEWEDIIYAELVAGRPVYYSGQSSEGGHAFVCDGYSQNSYFHFNWGWGGYEDGYFLLTALNPASGGIGSYEDGYTSSQSVIIGIKPGTESSEPTQSEIVATGGFYYQGSLSFNIQDSTNGYYLFYNPLGYTLNIQPGIKITPAAGGEPIYRECGTSVELPASYGYQVMTLGSAPRLEDGIYHVSPAFYPAGSNKEWQPVRIPIGKQDYVEMIVKNGTATFTNPGPDPDNTAKLLFGRPEFMPVVYGDLPVAVRIPVVNVGRGDFNEELGFSIMDNDSEYGSASSVISRYSIPAGTSQNIDLVFSDPLEAAIYDFSIIDMKNNTYLDNFKVAVKKADIKLNNSTVKVSDLSPDFFTAGKAAPLYFTVENSSYLSQKMEFTFNVLDGVTLRKIKTLPVNYNVTIPGSWSGRVTIRPTDLEMAPGQYYWQVSDMSGNPLSLPSPMIVNSEILEKDGISYIITSEERKEAVVVAPAGDPYSGEIEVPASIDGYKITALRNNAFTFSTATQVSLPESIERLDAGTFAACSSLRNFISESNSIIPFYKDIFNDAKLSSIWLNVAQNLIEDWHSTPGWSAMMTPSWFFKLDNVEIAEGLEINKTTGLPYAPYRVNYLTPLTLKFNAPEGKNVDLTVICNYDWIFQGVVNPASYTLQLPALGLSTCGEVRAKATSEQVAVEGVLAEKYFDVFSIDGRRVLTSATTNQIKALPTGLYIVNGRKILIR